jgi:hypothetical protein
MKQPPAPLTWPPVLTLETARRESDHALLALDQAFQRSTCPEDITAVFHAAALAEARLFAAQQEERPGWN